MSLPKHPPSHSPSPSKSSLRSTSGTTTIKQPTARALLPSPHFEEPILAQSQAVEQEEEQEQEQEQEHEGREYDGSTFQPFFTLIEDTLTHHHHHPTVHYIFADDDTDIVTEAACRSLVQDDPLVTTTETARPSSQQQDRDLDDELSRLPTPVPGVREHYLLLDVQAVTSAENTTTSYEVTRAHSLSAEWQVTSTSISSAPTIDAVDDGAEGPEGLMLRIDGRGVVPSDDDEEGGGMGTAKGNKEKETLEEMVRRFETGLADIRRAIEAGGSLRPDEQAEAGN